MDLSTQPIGEEPSAVSGARLVAIFTLIPTVPMLLISVAALALFYAAPARFSLWLARLPGETYLRSALIFAPVTLFAIVVLALLYALEREQPAAPAAPDQPDRDGATSREVLRQAARWLLIPAVLALAGVVALRVLGLIAPAALEGLLVRVPLTDSVGRALELAPWLLLGLVIALAFTGLDLVGGSTEARPTREPSGRPRVHSPPLARAVVVLLLLGGSPALVFSMVLLVFYDLRGQVLVELFGRLPQGALLRLSLLFAPASLFVVVALATLYLSESALVRSASEDSWEPAGGLATLLALRRLALWGLAAGILLGGTTLLAALGGVALLLR